MQHVPRKADAVQLGDADLRAAYVAAVVLAGWDAAWPAHGQRLQRVAFGGARLRDIGGWLWSGFWGYRIVTGCHEGRIGGGGVARGWLEGLHFWGIVDVGLWMGMFVEDAA